jgi:thioesterase domain-containing protein
VKIRGYRIELGEIEAVLNEHAKIENALVIVREDQPDEQRLVAYIVIREDLSDAELRDYLRAKLPNHMVPSAFVRLEELPLTRNGKINRKALPKPTLDPGSAGHIAPRNAVEVIICSIWKNLLGIERLGVADNFFDLGGHSLNAVTLASRLSHVSGNSMPVRTIFDYPTIEQMASYLMKENEPGMPSAIVPLRSRGARRPFFCVHPAGGLVNCFIPLVRFLDQDQPFYGFQAYGFEDGQEPISDIVTMAARYIVDMQRIQTTGPYQIGGWSMGGLIAYEMAQQLHSAGERVSLLVMFDTGFNTDFEDNQFTEDEVEAAMRDTLIRARGETLGLSALELGSLSMADLVRLVLTAEKEQNTDLAAATEKQYHQVIRNLIVNGDSASHYKPKS